MIVTQQSSIGSPGSSTVMVVFPDGFMASATAFWRRPSMRGFQACKVETAHVSRKQIPELRGSLRPPQANQAAENDR